MSQSQRNVLLGGIAVVLIAVAAVVYATRTRPSFRVPDQFGFKGVCLACSQESDATQAANESPPALCPHCGKAALYPWFFCYDCQKRFVPDLVRPQSDGPLRLPAWPKCPCRGCRSGNVGPWDPEMPTQQPVGDVPLPKWEE